MALIDEIRKKNPSLSDRSDDEIKSVLRSSPEFRYFDDDEFEAYVGGEAQRERPDETPGFLGGLSAGIDQVQAMGGGLLMLAGEAAESEGMYNAGQDIYQRNMEQAQENDLGYGFTDIRGPGDAWNWARYTAGNLLPMMATSLGSGTVGGLAAGLTARTLVGAAAKEGAKRAGQALGAVTASGGMETGMIMGETEDLDVSLAHGTLAGALDAITPVKVLRSAGQHELANKAASEISDRVLNDLKREAGRSARGAAGRGSLINLMTEAGTEFLQGLIGQHAGHWVENNGESLLTNPGDVDIKAMIDEAAAGGLMGGIMGAPAGLGERGQARRQVSRIEQARERAAAQGGDALDQTLAGEQAETAAQDEAPTPEPADPERVSELGNRLQMAMGGMDDLQSLARGSSYQGQTRLRNITRLLDNAEKAFEGGEYGRAETLLQRADGIATDLRSALEREGSEERPARREGELVDEDEGRIAGRIGQDGRRLPPGDPSTIYAEGPAADQTQYDPRARNVRRDEGMQAGQRMRDDARSRQPLIEDSGTLYGEGPVAGNANTGMEQQTPEPTFDSSDARSREWERLWREEGVENPTEGDFATIDIEPGAPETDATERAGTRIQQERQEAEGEPRTRRAVVPERDESDRGAAGRVPTERIRIDPEAYQFRTDVDRESGTDSRLEGVQEWDDYRAGTVLLHEREDGSLYVADGHHRVRLAQELGQPVVNAQVVREADGVSVQDARRLAAENNIANDSATPLDVAKVFRDSEGSVDEVIAGANLPPRSTLARDGIAISRLGDDAFGAVVNGQIDEKSAAVIGRTFDDPDQQLAAVDVFQRVNPSNDTQRTLLANEVRNAGFDDAQGEQGGLFGDDPAESLIGERVRVLDRLRSDLVRDRRLFATLNRNAPRAEAAGNQINTTANRQQSDQSARAIDLLGRVATTPELNQAVNDAARRVRDGDDMTAVVNELKTRLTDGRQAAPTDPQRPADGQPAARRGQEPGRREQGPARDPDAREGQAEPRLADGQDQGLIYRANGQPFATETSALASGRARRARAQGHQARAVPVDGGFAVRINQETSDAQEVRSDQGPREGQGPQRQGRQDQGGEGLQRQAETGAEAGDGQAQVDADPLLATYDEQDLAARDQAQQQAEQAETDRRRQEEQRAQADTEADDFRLSGSDRPADVMAAGGQQDLMGAQPQREAAADTPPGRDEAPVESQQDADDLASATAFGTRPLTPGEAAFVTRMLEMDEVRQGPRSEILSRGRDAGLLADDNRLDVRNLTADQRRTLSRAVRNLPDEQARYAGLVDEIQTALRNAEAEQRRAQMRAVEAEPDNAEAPQNADESPTEGASRGQDALFSLAPPKDSAAFKRWFGDSKVVDDNGDPLVVYHGSESPFNTFAFSSDIGFHFGTREAAAERLEQTGVSDGHIRSFYASIQNPLELTHDPGEWRLKEIVGALPSHVKSRLARKSGEEFGTSNQGIADWLEDEGGHERLRQELREQGYDGVQYGNAFEGGDSFVVFDSEQVKSATENRGTFDPTSPDTRYAFAGERAQTADPHAMGRAREMFSQGHDPDVVRRETGWFVGADGKWRFEIDDSDARFLAHRDGTVGKLWTESLDRVLDHPKLFAAYPALRDMDVVSARGVDANGMYMRDSNEIVLNADRDSMEQFSTLLHEIQHGIQNIEGFATGGSPSTVATTLRRQILDRMRNRADGALLSEYRQRAEEYSHHSLAKRIVDLRNLSQPRQLFSDAEWYQNRKEIIDVHGVPPRRGEARRQYASQAAAWIANRLEENAPLPVKQLLREYGLDRQSDPLARDQENRRQLNNAYRRAERRYNKLDREQLREAWADQREAEQLRDVTGEEARDLYRRLYGETEARNVQARQSMTSEERRDTAPADTQDVPDSDVIVSYNGQEMASAPEPANAADAPEGSVPTVTLADDITAALDGIEELADVRVIQSAHELPPQSLMRMALTGVRPSDVRGIYIGGDLYVIADNVDSVADGVRAAVHEAVGHKGMRAVLGADLERVMLSLYRSLPNSKEGRQALAEVRRDYPFLDPAKREDRITIGEEMVAHLLEKGHRPKAWQRAVAKIRELLRRLFPSIGWTYTDALALGEQSREHLRQRQAGQRADAAERYSLRGKERVAFEQAFDDFSDSDKAAALKIGEPTMFRSAWQWWKEKTDRWQTKVRQGVVDQYGALQDIDRALYGDEMLSEKITQSAWVKARMSKVANGVTEVMFKDGRIEWNEKEQVFQPKDDGSMGLGAVLGQLGGSAEIHRFLGWIAGNRADKLRAEGRENLFDDGDIDAMKSWDRGNLADGQRRREVYERVFKEFQQYRDDVLAAGEALGVISPEQRQAWRDEFYVPFYRLSEEKGFEAGQLATSGLSRQQAVKKLKGGTSNLNNLLENTMMNFHHIIDAGLKNNAARQAIDNSKQLGIARQVPESNRDTGTSTFVMEGGKKVFYEIDDPLVYNAITALGHNGMNSTLMKALRGFKRIFTNTVTVTPQYIIANLMRDSIQAPATSDISKNVLGNVLVGSETLRDKKMKARMLAAGANFSFGHLYGTGQADELRAGMTRTLRDTGAARTPGGTMVLGLGNAASIVRKGWAKWNDVNNHFENVNRAAIYRQGATEGNQLRAAFEARDLMDFSSHGAWPATRVLIDIIPFLNARIQGLDKIYRSGVKPGGSVIIDALKGKTPNATDKQLAGRFWAVTGAVSLAMLALYLENHDEEWYDELEEWEKDTYTHFNVGDAKIRIPNPFEVGAIGTMMVRTAEQFVNDEATGELFVQRMGHMITQTFAVGMPQAMQPALDVYANKDSFTDRPIENMGMQNLSPELRKRYNTTAVATGISQMLNNTVGAIGNPETNPLALSPVQVDHLIGGYLGQVGAWGAGMADTVWRRANGHEAPSRRWYEFNPLRRFYQNLGDTDPYTRYGTVFYEGLTETGRAYSDVMELREIGHWEEAKERFEETRNLQGLRKGLNRAQRQLSKFNKQIEMIQRSDVSGELKRQRIDRIQEKKRIIQRTWGERIEKARSTER